MPCSIRIVVVVWFALVLAGQADAQLSLPRITIGDSLPAPTLDSSPAASPEASPSDLAPESSAEASVRAAATNANHDFLDAHDAPAPVTLEELHEKFKQWSEASKKTPTYPNVTVNGVFQTDLVFFSQDELSEEMTNGPLKSGADFRRARLSAKGSVYETMNYFFQMDFAFFGRPTFTDVWLEQTDLPLFGNVRIGQWKQPFSLEVVSSFRYTTFMERALTFVPFTPFRHLGIGFYDHADDLSTTWAASGFRTGQDQYGGSVSDSGGWGTAERLTWLPFWDEASGGRAYVHLGLGHYFSTPPNHQFNFRTIPEIYVGENGAGLIGSSGQPAPGAFNGTPFFLKTGTLDINQYNVVGTELLWVEGPFSLQSEIMVSFVDLRNSSGATLGGGYAQVGYFLTGEHRPYDRKAGAIDRVKPHENFFRVRTDSGVAQGNGAWEVAFRVSHLDLESGSVRGGQMTDLTAGVNWYLNPYAKLVFNYIHAFTDDPKLGWNDTDAVGLRAQIDF